MRPRLARTFALAPLFALLTARALQPKDTGEVNGHRPEVFAYKVGFGDGSSS